MTFTDNGPGIANIALALTDGYTTGNGMGLGLSGAKRLVNEFEIESAPGKVEGKRGTEGIRRDARDEDIGPFACLRKLLLTSLKEVFPYSRKRQFGIRLEGKSFEEIRKVGEREKKRMK